MSSKKKKILSECDSCNSFLLTKDYEKHTSMCGVNAQITLPVDGTPSRKEVTTEIPILKKGQYLNGFNMSVEKRMTYLPEECMGWLKKHAILVNKETMTHLNLFGRQPCVVTLGDGTEIIGSVWPCDVVPVMRISCPLSANERFLNIKVIESSNLLESGVFSIGQTENRNLFLSSAFVTYLKVYLSGAFVSPLVPFDVNYFGMKVEVKLKRSLLDQMNSIKIDGKLLEKKTTTEIFEITSQTVISIDGCEPEKILSDSLEAFKGGKQRVGLSNIGGMSKAKEDVNTFLVKPFLEKKRICSTIIHGLTGNGKTLLLNILANQFGGKSVMAKSLSELVELYSLIQDKSLILLIDNIESWELKENLKAITVLSSFMDSKGTVIMCVRDIDSIGLELRRRFLLEIELPVPTLVERLEIMELIMNSEEKDKIEIKDFAQQTHGFTGADILSVCELSRQQGGTKCFTDSIKRVRPTGIRQFIFEVPNVSWDDIGGNEKLKEEIKQAIIWPQQHAEAFVRFGVDPPSGILLYGPPGCSKTLIARALASQSKLNFLSVKGPELFSKYVGESEKAVRDLFHRARQVAPTILFFDEIDAVGGKRGGDTSSAVGDRVLAQLLTELDGLEKKSRVIVLAATNRPDTIDSALMRPGRLDRSIYVTLPDLETRKQIMTLRLKKMTLEDDVDKNELAEKTEGYSGAEIVAFCQTAALKAMREDVNGAKVSLRHFTEALHEVVPRTDKELLASFERFQRGEE
uniref:Spermatogenesis-associated protein 5 n=1 Tax=Rhabditophanes sp. KR3021 TaxID=114890 RepID=A0AC35U047_9BILA